VNRSDGSEMFDCYFNKTLADGNYTFNVTAFDYGGSSLGNNISSSINFSLDATPHILLLHPLMIIVSIEMDLMWL